MEREPSVTVVVPAHQAAAEIGLCLDALIAAGFAAGEILLVDDGSTDATGACARRKGVRVLRNDTALGAAEARNRGVAAVATDLVVFVDADVVVHRGGRARIIARFAADSNLAALFGSYDDAPPAPSVVARYRNMLHHYVHQRGRTDAGSFWTGLGAVRRRDFVGLGGFDASWEKIEDAEFGVRLKRAGGRIRLDRDLLGTHLKAWTTGSMFRTDLFGRAIPWTRLILFDGGPRDDLNVTGAHRASVVMVALFCIGVAAMPFDLSWAWLCLAAAAGFVTVNRGFLGFLAARFGAGFAAASVPYHALHYLAGGLGYGWVLVTEAPGRLLSRSAARP